MIHVLHGDDTFSAQAALRELLQAVGVPDVREANTLRMDAAEFDLPRLVAEAQAMPFLAERRLVVVRGLLDTAEEPRGERRRARRPGRGFDTTLPPRLAEALRGLPPTTDVAFVDGRLTKPNPLLKRVAPLAQVREFPFLRGDTLARWVRERVSSKGGAITGPALRLLMELVGSNLWAMDNELEKLTISCEGRAIDEADVNALVPSARESNIFAAVDAIMERRTSTATELVDGLLRGGATASYVLAMIARQARLVALAQELASQRVPQDQWGERLGIQRDFVLRKMVDQARRHSASQLRRLYHLLLEADVSMKTGDLSDELAMTQFLVRAGGPARTPRSASGVR